MDYGPPKMLLREYAQLGKWAKAKTWGELAVWINPFDNETLLSLGQVYLELGDGKAALHAYDGALLTKPEMRRPALAHIGRAKAYLAMGDKKKAKAALADAMKTEPENADAIALKKKL
jgi:tetratricopeptide (TPR) repeat protein